MENSEEILQMLERFTEQKAKQIPKKLDDYLEYVAKTGDSVFNWSNIKYLLREKLLHAIKNFNENIARIEDVPSYPNVDPFNFETMESMLLERFELFNAAPFTIQRLCELLVEPRKHYTRIDKYMRALEKNILVVTTVQPGRMLENETANGDDFDGLDVDIELDEQDEQRVIEIAQKILVETKLSTSDEPSKERTVENERKEPEDEPQQPMSKKLKLTNEESSDLKVTASVSEAESHQDKSLTEAKENIVERTDETQKAKEKLENIEPEEQTSEAEQKSAKENEEEEITTVKIDSPAKNVTQTDMPEEPENVQTKSKPQATSKDESTKNSEAVTLNTQNVEQTKCKEEDQVEDQVEEKDAEETTQPLDVAVDQEPIPAEERPTYLEITTEIDVIPECKEEVIIVTKEGKENADENSTIVITTPTEPEKKVSAVVVEPMEADELEDIATDKTLDIEHIEISADTTANTNMDVDRDDVGQQQDEAMDVGNVK